MPGPLVKMQTANVMVSIGGADSGTIVPKFGVTAAEIAVLQAIHGNDAVTEVEPGSFILRSHRDERERLADRYKKMEGDKDVSVVNVLYPGAAARVFQRLDELELQDEMFKAEKRASPLRAMPEPDETLDEGDETSTFAGAAPARAPLTEGADEADDGVEEMSDRPKVSVLD